MKQIIVLLLLISGLKMFSQNNEAITNPDVMPEYPGGLTEMMKFIQTNLKNPIALKNDSLSHGCKSMIEFTIDREGFVKNVFVVRSCIGCNQCDNEAVKVIEKMPKWKPGIKDKKAVAVKMGLPVFFTLK
jgi:protein TonB